MNDRIDEIRSLLHLFYEGTSTPEQEQRLADLLESGPLPDDLIPDRKLFVALREQSESIKAPAAIEENVLKAISAPKRKPFLGRRLTVIVSAAAATAILIAIGISLLKPQTEAPQEPILAQATETIQDTPTLKVTHPEAVSQEEQIAQAAPQPKTTRHHAKRPKGAVPATQSQPETLTPEEEESLIKGLKMLDKAGEQLAQARAATVSGLETAQAAFQKFD